MSKIIFNKIRPIAEINVIYYKNNSIRRCLCPLLLHPLHYPFIWMFQGLDLDLCVYVNVWVYACLCVCVTLINNIVNPRAKHLWQWQSEPCDSLHKSRIYLPENDLWTGRLPWVEGREAKPGGVDILSVSLFQNIRFRCAVSSQVRQVRWGCMILTPFAYYCFVELTRHCTLSPKDLGTLRWAYWLPFARARDVVTGMGLYLDFWRRSRGADRRVTLHVRFNAGCHICEMSGFCIRCAVLEITHNAGILNSLLSSESYDNIYVLLLAPRVSEYPVFSGCN